MRPQAADTPFKGKSGPGDIIVMLLPLQLFPRSPVNEGKTDFRDAKKLALTYAHGLLTVVHPSSEQEESIRSLIRARSAFKEDEKRVKHRINSLLISQDVQWYQSK